MSISRRQLLAAPAALLAPPPATAGKRRVAAAVTIYTHNSHADVIVSKLLQGENLDFRSRKPDLELVSLYVDQFPEGDMSRALARQHGFRLAGSIEEALTLGGPGLAVDGVLLVGEHGKYPTGPLGEELYPRKRFFDETTAVFRRSGRSVPVFSDKHLSHSWEEAKAMYETSRSLHFPLMAGSSVPLTWRRPPLNVRRGAELKEAVGISFHTLYGYGFHALEMLQCMAERRRGGETGIRRVRCLEGEAVSKAGEAGEFDLGLLDAALGRLERPVDGDTPDARRETLRKGVKTPTAFCAEYRDGFRATILTLNYVVGQWALAWRERGKPEPEATLFWTQEARPLGHFTFLVRGIEQMMKTGKPTWPVERTLLTSGLMHFLLESRSRGGEWLETPELAIRYRPTYEWSDPGPPPPARPLDQQ